MLLVPTFYLIFFFRFDYRKKASPTNRLFKSLDFKSSHSFRYFSQRHLVSELLSLICKVSRLTAVEASLGVLLRTLCKARGEVKDPLFSRPKMVRNIIIRVDNLVKMFCLNKWRNKNSFSVVPNDQPPFHCHDVAWLFSGMAAKCDKEPDNLPRVSVQLNLKQYQVGVSYLVYLCRFTVRQYFVSISILTS